MRDYEEVQAMVTVMEAKHAAIIDRYQHIAATPLAALSPGDKVFLLNGGGVSECRALTSQLNALAWVLETT